MISAARERGRAAELIFESRLLELGLETAVPSVNNAFDLLIRTRNQKEWETVQIKRAFCSVGKKPRVDLRKGNKTRGLKKYQPGDFDYLGVVSGAEIFLIPFEEIEGYGQIYLTPDWDQFKL